MTTLADKVRKRNPVSFFKDLKAYEAGLGTLSGDTITDTLRRQGICVLEGHVPPAEVAAIRAEVEPGLRALHAGAAAEPGRSTSYPAFGTYELTHVEREFPACRRFVEDRRILDVVERYSVGAAVSQGAVASLRADPHRNDEVDGWHTDTWLFRFKAMLYLTDVGPENAPLRYLAGSHTGEHWRWSKFCSSYAQQAAPDGAVWPYTLRSKAAAAQARKADFTPMVCSAPAGTVLLFDTRGIHRGTTLEAGERLILNHSFWDRDDLAPSR